LQLWWHCSLSTCCAQPREGTRKKANESLHFQSEEVLSTSQAAVEIKCLAVFISMPCCHQSAIKHCRYYDNFVFRG
jgi:hypothetical protein